MKIRQLSEEDGQLSFEISDTDASFMNAIRKSVIEEVPTLAIEDIEFRENSSALYDEVIGHRLGLIPLTTDLGSYTPQDECTCEGEGCAKCSVVLSLKAQGPGVVEAGAMESKDPGVAPAQPKMPIVKLLEEQTIAFEATAVVGRGKVHMKWAPGLVYYNNKIEVSINDQPDEPEQVAEATDGALEVKNGKLKVADEDALQLHRTELDAYGELFDITTSDDTFIMHVESWGHLSPQAIIEEAIGQLNQKLDAFSEAVKEV